MLDRYSILGLIELVYFKIRTYFLFKKARLIRFPMRIRGRKFISISEGFTSGFNCRIDAFPLEGHKDNLIEIGKNVQINDYVHIAAHKKIVIKDNVLIASKVFITDHDHGSYAGNVQDSPLTIPYDRKLKFGPVHIEENVWLGENVSILAGVTIGKGSIIGAMSVVSKDIPAYCIAVGVPAKVVKRYDFDLEQWIKI